MSFTKKIFIVDDDEMLSMMLTDYLSDLDWCSINVFSTGEEALQNMQLNPDFVVLDFNLNSIDPNAANGLQILQEMKKRNKNILVIMYSSQNQYGEVVDTIGKEALEYVIKDKSAFKRVKEIIQNSLNA